VGDNADGYPGIPGWGARSAAALFSRYAHLPDIPIADPGWRPAIANGARLARSLREGWDRALLFRDLATLRTDAPVFASVDELAWKGPGRGAGRLAERIAALPLLERGKRLRGA
jgi:5'-3' exonuclease